MRNDLTISEYVRELLEEHFQKEQKGEMADERHSPGGTPESLDALTRRIEALETRSTLAISGIDQSVSGLLKRLESSETSAAVTSSQLEQVLEDLRDTQDALQKKVRTLEEDDSAAEQLDALKSLERALGKLASHVHTETERLSDGSQALTERVGEIETKVETRLDEATARIDKAVESAELRTEGSIRHLADRFRDFEMSVGQRLKEAESSGEALGDMREEVSGALEAVESSLERMQARLERAESAAETSASQAEQAYDALERKIDDVANAKQDGPSHDEVEQRLETVASDLRRSLEGARLDMAREMETALAKARPEALKKLETAIGQLRQRLADSEARTTRSIETVSEQVGRMSASLDKRLRTVESRNDTGVTEAMHDELARLSGDMDARLEALETREDHLIDRIGTQMKELADKLEDRVTESEKRSAGAIEQVGEQVSGVAQRMQARQEQAMRKFAEQADQQTKRQDAKLSETLTGISERMESLQKNTAASLSPVQKAIASLATRLESLEDFTSPPHSERQSEAMPVIPDFPAPDARQAETVPAPLVEDDTDDEDFEAGIENWDTDESIFADEDDGRADPPIEYAADLPEDETPANDPYAEFDPWEEDEVVAGPQEEELFGGREEQRDEGVPPPYAETDDDLDIPPYRVDATPERAGPDDYLSRARKAAMDAANEQKGRKPEKERKGLKKRAAAATSGGGQSRLKLIAAVSVIALLAAGATGYLALRGNDEPMRVASNPQEIESTAPRAMSMTGAPPRGSEIIDEESAGAMGGIEPFEPGAGDEPYPGADLESDMVPGSGDISAGEDMTASDPALTEDLDAQPVSSAVAEPEPQPPEPEPEPARPVLDLPQIPDAQTIEAAAASSNQLAMYRLGQDRIDAGDEAAGADLVRRAAEQGLPPAQYRLSKLYEKGIGLDANLAQSRRWTERAAVGGNVKAMYDLAVFYAEGKAGPQDYATAANWFEQAANHGFLDAQYNLGVLYENGLGVASDPAEAAFWFQLAANQGDAAAVDKISELGGQLSDTALQSINARSQTWSSERPDAEANGVFAESAWQFSDPDQIRAVQEILNGFGYDAGAPDGLLGPGTKSALAEWQAENGFQPTGRPTAQTVEALNAAAAEASGR